MCENSFAELSSNYNNRGVKFLQCMTIIEMKKNSTEKVRSNRFLFVLVNIYLQVGSVVPLLCCNFQFAY